MWPSDKKFGHPSLTDSLVYTAPFTVCYNHARDLWNAIVKSEFRLDLLVTVYINRAQSTTACMRLKHYTPKIRKLLLFMFRTMRLRRDKGLSSLTLYMSANADFLQSLLFAKICFSNAPTPAVVIAASQILRFSTWNVTLVDISTCSTHFPINKKNGTCLQQMVVLYLFDFVMMSCLNQLVLLAKWNYQRASLT